MDMDLLTPHCAAKPELTAPSREREVHTKPCLTLQSAQEERQSENPHRMLPFLSTEKGDMTPETQVRGTRPHPLFSQVLPLLQLSPLFS